MRLAVAPRSWRAAGPAAPPNRRASSRRTRCGRAARRRAALGDCWRQATHAAILVAAHCQCANQSASISSNARCSFFILWPQPSADARTAYKPTDNAKTGLNRDCFGTLAPGARLDHRAPAAAGRPPPPGHRKNHKKETEGGGGGCVLAPARRGGRPPPAPRRGGGGGGP